MIVLLTDGTVGKVGTAKVGDTVEVSLVDENWEVSLVDKNGNKIYRSGEIEEILDFEIDGYGKVTSGDGFVVVLINPPRRIDDTDCYEAEGVDDHGRDYRVEWHTTKNWAYPISVERI